MAAIMPFQAPLERRHRLISTYSCCPLSEQRIPTPDPETAANDAALETLERQGIPYVPGYESQLYHPSVIIKYPDHFNPAAHP